MPTEIISAGTLENYINTHSSSLTTNQINALRKIKSYEGNQLIKSNLGKPILFFFEGVGGYSSDPTISLYNPARYNGSTIIGYDPPGYRYSAMVVVIKQDSQTGNNIIDGLFKDASTLPDQAKVLIQPLI